MSATTSTSEPPSNAPSAGQKVRRPVNGWLVWFVVATGPAVWMAHLAGAAALVPLQCRLGTTWMVNAWTAICAVAIFASILTAFWLRHRALRSDDDSRPVRSTAFVALVGAAWGIISLAVTILEGLPNTALHSCPR